MRFNKIEQALKIAEEMVAKSPKKSDVYFFRARVYAALGQSQKAISDYTQSIKLNPKDSTGYTNRGFEKLVLKDYKGSLEDSKTSMTMNQRSAYPVTNTALVYFLQGDYSHAAEWYKTAAEMWNTRERKVRVHLYSALCFRLAGKEKEAQSEIAIANSSASKTNLVAVIAFLQGKGTETNVVSVSTDSEYQSVAKVILGTELLRLKKTKAGRDYLSWVVTNGTNREDELYMAKSLLERKTVP